MAKHRRDIKYLSQSILLEEQGLPRVNTWMILIVFAMVAAFVVWSIQMEIDEVAKVDGNVVLKSDSVNEYSLVLKIPSKEMSSIKDKASVFITIPGLAEKEPFRGTIKEIEQTPKTGIKGEIYYEAALSLGMDETKFSNVNKMLMAGMVIHGEVITGKRTLFQYILSPINTAQKNAFKEK